jgi:hypothetical protein
VSKHRHDCLLTDLIDIEKLYPAFLNGQNVIRGITLRVPGSFLRTIFVHGIAVRPCPAKFYSSRWLGLWHSHRMSRFVMIIGRMLPEQRAYAHGWSGTFGTICPQLPGQGQRTGIDVCLIEPSKQAKPPAISTFTAIRKDCSFLGLWPCQCTLHVIASLNHASQLLHTTGAHPSWSKK